MDVCAQGEDAAPTCVAAENSFERTGGLSAWGRAPSSNGYGANFHVSLIDNVVQEGNHVWNYNTRLVSR